MVGLHINGKRVSLKKSIEIATELHMEACLDNVNPIITLSVT